MALAEEDIRGLSEMNWLLKAFSQVVGGSVDNVYLWLNDLALSDSFWTAWDRLREDAEGVSEEYVASDEFLTQEATFLRDAGLREHEIALLVELLRPVARRASQPSRLPPSETVRQSIAQLSQSLESSQRTSPQGGGFLRMLGRGILILGGGGIAVVDAGVCVASGGVGAPALASMGLGMGAVAAGTFDDPAAGREFLRSGRDR